mgnify:FL=1
MRYYFAEFIAQQSDCEMDDIVVISAALVSEKNQQGDVCVLLDQYLNQPLFSTIASIIPTLPKVTSISAWQKLLEDSPCVGNPGDNSPLIF